MKVKLYRLESLTCSKNYFSSICLIEKWAFGGWWSNREVPPWAFPYKSLKNEITDGRTWKDLESWRHPKFFKGAKLPNQAASFFVVILLDLLLLFYSQINSNSAINFYYGCFFFSSSSVFISSYHLAAFALKILKRAERRRRGKSCMLLTQGFRYRDYSILGTRGEHREGHYTVVFCL